MIGAILLTFNIGFFGLLVSYFFGLKMFFEQRIAAALAFGLVFLAYISFATSHFWGLSSGNLALSLLVINLTIFGLWRKRFFLVLLDDLQNFTDRYSKRSWQIFGGFLILFVAIFSYLAAGLLTLKDGTYYVQPVHAYGDISLHLGIISSFVHGNNFPPQNPNFAGTPISYPFMVDFLTAFFVSPMGLPVEQAMAFTGVLLYGILIVLLTFFVINLTKSKKIALLTLGIFLLNGGFGFIYFWDGFVNSGKNIFQFLLELPQDYTAIKDLGYWWININLSMLLPQRSFLFGFGVSLLILSIFLQLKNNFDLRGFILVVILLSLLPLIHAHSLVALSVFVLYFLYFIFKDKKIDKVLIFLIGLNGLVVAYLLSRQFLAQSANIFSLFSWQIGWMSSQESIIRFYLKNFGIVLLVIPFALYWLRKQSELFMLGCISLTWFLLPSLMIFQPWDFDNIKLFVYWYFFAALLTAAFVVKIASRSWWQIGGAVLLVGVIILAGSLDIFRILTSAGTRYSIYGKEAIEMAEFVKQNTPENAVFVSADKFDNPVVSLAGRKLVMGFSPWLWTYGLNYSPRQQFVTNFLAGNATADDLENYQVNYAVLFPHIQNYTQNQQYFDSNYQLIYDKDGYRIYKL